MSDQDINIGGRKPCGCEPDAKCDCNRELAAPIGSGFPVEVELKILERALMMTQNDMVPRDKWSTWDCFAGRTVHHQESTESWLKRILQIATKEVTQNDALRDRRANDQ